jgi:arabinofuranosyltransferase
MALTVFTVVHIANSWVGDDAYIAFRVSDNLINGYGPRWNVDERVQAFTNPLWMFLMAGVGWVTGELFYTSMVVSYLFMVTLLAIVWWWLPRQADRWLALILILTSKAFVDYSSSGLEYPMSYLLLTIFVVKLVTDPPDVAAAPDRLPLFVFIAAMAFFNRADTILLYLPAVVWLIWRGIKRLTLRSVTTLVAAAAPAWGWLLFSLIYYGFPFPNTFYAKASFGAPRWLQLEQGLAYLVSSLRFDPITLSAVAAAAGVAWAVRDTRQRLLALGACLYVGYTIWVGGDFMAGRFFALPYLTSALILVHLPKARLTALTTAALLLLLNVVNPIAPFKTAPFSDIGWPWRSQNGVKDERGATFKGVNILYHEVFKRVPDNFTAREGYSYAASPERVLVHPWIGEVGFFAGPKKYIIDPNGLSDPLLARLPVGQDFYFAFWASHWTRAIPAGYVESRKAKQNLIEDPVIREYFDRILNVTTGPLFTRSRFRDIWHLNWGRYRDIHKAVKARLRLNYVAQVNNPLFATDAGELDPRGGILRAVGKPGYLLLGPGVPLEPGTYRITWNGTAPNGDVDLGFVEVCHNACRRLLSRTPIAPRDGVVAEAIAPVGPDVRDVEFRMYVHRDSQVQLESVAIRQQ